MKFFQNYLITRPELFSLIEVMGQKHMVGIDIMKNEIFPLMGVEKLLDIEMLAKKEKIN